MIAPIPESDTPRELGDEEPPANEGVGGAASIQQLL